MINELLLDAIRENNLDSVKLLLDDVGADVDYRKQDGKTVLMIAAEIGSGEIVELLVKKGVDVLAKDKNNKTAHDLAADSVKDILKKATFNALLLKSAQQNRIDAVKFFLKRGADVHARDKAGNRASDLATDEAVKDILRAAAQGNVVNAASQTQASVLQGLVQPQSGAMSSQERVAFSGSKKTHDAVSQTPVPVSQSSSKALSLFEQKKLDELLMQAAEKGNNVFAVESLLLRGANVNVKNKDGMTALTYASQGNYEKIVKILLIYGADVNLQAISGMTALMYASLGNEEIMEILLKHGADVNLRTPFGMTALMYASIRGNEAAVRMLLDAGADVSLKDIIRKTALKHATNEAVRNILRAAAQGNVVNAASQTPAQPQISALPQERAAFSGAKRTHDAVSQTPSAQEDGESLLRAVKNNDISAAAAQENAQPAASQEVQAVEQPMPLLVRIPVGAIQRNMRPEFNKDLLNAVEEGEIRSVRSCLAKGADVNARAAKQRTALMIASYEDWVDIVQILIDAGADLDAVDTYEKTALMIASSHGYVDVVTALVKGGADVNLKDKFGHTAKDLASNEQIIAILGNVHESSSEKNAGLSGSKKRAENAFSQADEARAKRSHVARVSGAKRGNDEIAQTSEDQELNKSLLDAVTNNQEKTARHLLSRGADVDFANEEGLTCLMLAIILHDDGKIAQMLIAEGADVNLADHQSKNTALMSAAQNGKAELVKLLLGKNADVTAKNKDEKTALDLASDAEVRQILEKASETQKLDQNDVEVAGFLARLSNSSSPSSQGQNR